MQRGSFLGQHPASIHRRSRPLTNDPEDAQDVGGKDDQQVDTREQANGNEHVPQPAELAVRKQHLLEGAAYLGSGAGRVINLSATPVRPASPALPGQGPGHVQLAHRKQNDGHCERDGCQHSHAHAQDQYITRVHLAVGVQQLRLDPVCGRQGGRSAGGPRGAGL